MLIMLELLGMMRILNCVMAMIGVFVGALVALGGLGGIYSVHFLLALAAVFLVTGAGNVFNDYADIEADKINRPKRLIPSGAVSRNSAFTFSITLFVLGNLCAGLINGLCLTLALINSALLILYSLFLQHKILIGNIAIGYLVGSLFLFGGAVFLNGKIWTVLVLMILAMLANIAREIVKDLEDLEGDRKSFLKKMASKKVKLMAERFGLTKGGVRMKYDERTMIVLAILCLLFAVAFSGLPYYYGLMRISYLIIVAVADVVLLSCVCSLLGEEKKKKGYGRISKRLKIGMFIALIAFIVGAFL